MFNPNGFLNSQNYQFQPPIINNNNNSLRYPQRNLSMSRLDNNQNYRQLQNMSLVNQGSRIVNDPFNLNHLNFLQNYSGNRDNHPFINNRAQSNSLIQFNHFIPLQPQPTIQNVGMIYIPGQPNPIPIRLDLSQYAPQPPQFNSNLIQSQQYQNRKISRNNLQEPVEFSADLIQNMPLPQILEKQNSKQQSKHSNSKIEDFQQQWNQEIQNVNEIYQPPQIISQQNSLNQSKLSKKPIQEMKYEKVLEENSINDSLDESDDRIEKQKELKRRRKQEEKKKAVKNAFFIKTNVMRIRFMFLALYINTLRYGVQAKKIMQKKIIQETTDLAEEACNDWMANGLEEVILDILNSKMDLGMIPLQDAENAKKKDKVKQIIIKSLENLLKAYDPQDLGKEFFQFITQIAFSFRFPPNEYFFQLEVMKLEFTFFGSLGNMGPQQTRMTIFCYVFIRNLIFQNILKAWERHPNQNATEQLFLIQRNSIIISSVFHDIIVDWIDKNVPDIDQDISEFKQENLIKPRVYPLSDQDENEERKRQILKPEILIEDILPQTQTIKYFQDKNKKHDPWVKQVTDKMIQISDKIVDQANQIIEQEKTQYDKDRMTEKMIATDLLLKKNRIKNPNKTRKR